MYIKKEIENMLTKGMKTLYINGIDNIVGMDDDDITKIVDTSIIQKCTVIRIIGFSMDPNADEFKEWEPWEKLINTILDKTNVMCVFEFDSKYVESFLETGLAEKDNLVPVVNVNLPYNNQLGYNAVIKIADNQNQNTNPGTWCHQLHDLKSLESFTHWNAFNQNPLL